jgi:hypothetical protein
MNYGLIDDQRNLPEARKFFGTGFWTLQKDQSSDFQYFQMEKPSLQSKFTLL